MFLYQGLLARCIPCLLQGNLLFQPNSVFSVKVSPGRNNRAILWAMISIPLKQNIAILGLTGYI